MSDYYFAYGSNLNLGQFARRCPGARMVGKLVLPDFQLVFRGVADIVDATGAAVDGAIYKITPECERALDRYEGYPQLYYKRSFVAELTTKSGRKRVVDVMFYVMARGIISPPCQGYLDCIREGYDDWEILHARLEAAVAHAQREQAAAQLGFDPGRYGSRRVVKGRRGRPVQGLFAHGH